MQLEPIIERIKSYRRDWRNHVGRMQDERSPKRILNYTPTGRRSKGGLMKRLMDTSSSSFQGTNSAKVRPASAI